MIAIGGHFLVVEQVAQLIGVKPRTIHEYTRQECGIPHRVLPGGRRCLFERAALEAWMNGAKLERIDLPRGGRIVRVCDQMGVDQRAA
jgi:predicted DNA-binding transcriptional regulator AlpA